MKLKHLALILVLLIFLVLGYLGWKIRHSGQATPVVAAADMSFLQQPESDDRLARTNFRDELQAFLAKEDFQSLEKIATEITQQKSRFPGGDWKLKRFFESVASPAHGYNEEIVDWPDRVAKLRKWKGQSPGSIYSSIALAKAYLGNASDHPHDGKDPVRVFPDNARAYEEAETLLKAVYDRRSECVAWFTAMQNVAYRKNADLTEMKALLDEGVKLEPLYYDLYLVHANYLLPKNFGKRGDWEDFIEQSAQSIGGIDGEILYSEICWQISQIGSKEFFTENKVSYPRIRNGFIERLKKYGSSYRYLNAFCLMAGAAIDPVTANALMNTIGENWEPDLWHSKKIFDEHKQWASQYAGQ